ncbi:hypothetical protein F5X97DRAFT_283124 [Nemania serpens]|nr:hypothetical protein F5X97DRAFT_283124 [Nemania serpens]
MPISPLALLPVFALQATLPRITGVDELRTDHNQDIHSITHTRSHVASWLLQWHVVGDCDTPEEPGKAGSTEESRILSPVPIQLACAEQAATLESGQQDRTSERVEINFRMLVRVRGEWMIGVEMKTPPEKRDGGVGDCAGGMRTPNMVPEAFDSPICIES